MNTKDRWITTVCIVDPVRYDLWKEVFLYATVPIQSTIPCKVNVPGHQYVDAYMLDLDAISDEQREGVIMLLAKTFSEDVNEVRLEIDKGVAILAEGVTVHVSDEDSDHYYGDEEEDFFTDDEED